MKIKKWIMLGITVTIAIVIIYICFFAFIFDEYGCKPYYVVTVNDVGAIGGALEDYFANPANKTVTTQYNPASAEGSRPYILIGKTGSDSDGYNANTLLLSASTTMQSAAQSVPTAAGIGGAAAGAFQVGSHYVIYAYNSSSKERKYSDSHWVFNPISQIPCPQGIRNCCYFKTL